MENNTPTAAAAARRSSSSSSFETAKPRKIPTLKLTTLLLGLFKFVITQPLLTSTLLFFIYIFRTFPLAFSLLISFSPTLICTGVLLCTLLTLGQRNAAGSRRNHHNKVNGKELDDDSKRRIDDDHHLLSPPWKHRLMTVSVEPCSFEDRRKGSGSGIFRGKFAELRKDIVEKEMKGSLSPLAGVINTSVMSNNEDNIGGGGRKRVTFEEFPKSNLSKEGTSDKVIEDEEEEKEKKVDDDGDDEFTAASSATPSSISDSEGEDNSSIKVDFRSNLSEIQSLLDENRDQDQKEKEEEEETEKKTTTMIEKSRRLIDWTEDEKKDVINMSSTELGRFLEGIIGKRHRLGDDDDHNGPRIDEENDNHSKGEEQNVVDRDDHRGTFEKEDNEEGEGYDDEEEEDDDDEEEAGKELHGAKSAIAWTEDDKKNMETVGNLQIERDQRLEKIIAKRRAAKKKSTTTQKKSSVTASINNTQTNNHVNRREADAATSITMQQVSYPTLTRSLSINPFDDDAFASHNQQILEAQRQQQGAGVVVGVPVAVIGDSAAVGVPLVGPPNARNPFEDDTIDLEPIPAQVRTRQIETNNTIGGGDDHLNIKTYIPPTFSAENYNVTAPDSSGSTTTTTVQVESPGYDKHTKLVGDEVMMVDEEKTRRKTTKQKKKEAIFRRYQSFGVVGSSFYGFLREESEPLSPYFVSEQQPAVVLDGGDHGSVTTTTDPPPVLEPSTSDVSDNDDDVDTTSSTSTSAEEIWKQIISDTDDTMNTTDQGSNNGESSSGHEEETESKDNVDDGGKMLLGHHQNESPIHEVAEDRDTVLLGHHHHHQACTLLGHPDDDELEHQRSAEEASVADGQDEVTKSNDNCENKESVDDKLNQEDKSHAITASTTISDIVEKSSNEKEETEVGSDGGSSSSPSSSIPGPRDNEVDVYPNQSKVQDAPTKEEDDDSPATANKEGIIGTYYDDDHHQVANTSLNGLDDHNAEAILNSTTEDHTHQREPVYDTSPSGRSSSTVNTNPAQFSNSSSFRSNDSRDDEVISDINQ